MEEKSLHIVIVGHVDHGKSTLVGRLFYDTGSLSPEKMTEIKKASEDLGKELEFAYVMDNLEEERTKGITIDIAHTFFKTKKRRYVIIDAPGHKEFLKNMISGTSQADAALLLVDVSRGIEEQTLRHCCILSLLGIQQIAVIVNKMDIIEYSEKGFIDVKKGIEQTFRHFKIPPPAHIIPISASKGENVAKRTERLSWYSGPTVLDALDGFNTPCIEEKDLRFPVQDVYTRDGTVVAVGRIEAGILCKGKEVIILPQRKKTVIIEIKKYLEDAILKSPTGDCVGVCLDNSRLKRGDVLTDRLSSATVTDSIHANIFWMINKEYSLDMPITFKCTTQEMQGRISKIHRRFDPALVEVVKKNADTIGPAEVAEVDIKLDAAVVVDKFADIPNMGQFILEHAGHPVACGIII